MTAVLPDKEQLTGVTDKVTPELSLKTCATCLETYPLDNAFFRWRQNYQIWEKNCRECNRAKARAWYEEHKPVRPQPGAYDEFYLPTLMSTVDTGWKARAKCAGLTQWFELHPLDQRDVCEGCPVIEDCRRTVDILESAWPLAKYGCAGIWAGEGFVERRKRRAAQAKGGTPSRSEHEAIQ